MFRWVSNACNLVLNCQSKPVAQFPLICHIDTFKVLHEMKTNNLINKQTNIVCGVERKTESQCLRK